MRINFNPQYYRPSFGLIKLTSEDKDKSEELIKRINSSPIDSKAKDIFAIELYDVFEPYIEKEGRQKAKKSYVVEEVISDIKIKFWEFINQVNSKKSLENLIEKIDEYKPDQTLLKLKYSHNKPLDAHIGGDSPKTFKDNLTSDDMPIPLSPPDEKEVAEAKNELEKTLSATKLSQKGRSRLLKKSKGLSYRTIAKEEGVCANVIRNSVGSSILRLQNDNNSLSPKNKRRIENLAKELNVSDRDIVHAALRNIWVLSYSPETVRENVEKSSELFGVSKEEFIKAAITTPNLFCQKPETLNKNAETSCKLFGVSKEEFVKAAIKRPQLLYQKPETLNKNVETSSKLFGIKKEEFIKAAMKQPQLFHQKPETLNRNIETSSKLFGIKKEEFIKAAMKQPQLFFQKPETLNRNIETSSKLLGIKKEEFIKTAIKYPPLFFLKPETLNKNIETSSKLFGIKKEEFVKASIHQPALFYLKPETLNRNMELSIKLLGIKKEEFIKSAMQQPQLFLQKPETINKNIETSSELFGISKEEFIKIAIKWPQLFYYKPETLNKKSKILNYYKKLQNKSDNKLKITLISYDKLYNNILALLLKKNYYPKLTRKKIRENLPELLKNILNNSHKIEFEIPEDDVVQDFAAFCEKYSMKTFGENIFKIKTV